MCLRPDSCWSSSVSDCPQVKREVRRLVLQCIETIRVSHMSASSPSYTYFATSPLNDWPISFFNGVLPYKLLVTDVTG
jgi:hypothetical protein